MFFREFCSLLPLAFSFFRAVLFSTDMRKKRYWEGVRGKMEERTKAVITQQPFLQNS